MVTAWMLFLGATFFVSVIAMTYIQTRVAHERGWRALREARFLDTYWRERSTLLRWLLWPGLIAFAITCLICTAALILQYFGLVTAPKQ